VDELRKTVIVNREVFESMLREKREEVLGGGACHILAVKLFAHLAGKNFGLKRIAILDDDIPMRQALHVYVARDGVAIDCKGQRPEKEILEQYANSPHARGRGIAAIETTCVELESERPDEPGFNRWRLRLDKEFRQLAEPIADQWIASHQQLLAAVTFGEKEKPRSIFAGQSGAGEA
jgi:hypothetical protein